MFVGSVIVGNSLTPHIHTSLFLLSEREEAIGSLDFFLIFHHNHVSMAVIGLHKLLRTLFFNSFFREIVFIHVFNLSIKLQIEKLSDALVWYHFFIFRNDTLRCRLLCFQRQKRCTLRLVVSHVDFTRGVTVVIISGL